jgi:hypothetical protein
MWIRSTRADHSAGRDSNDLHQGSHFGVVESCERVKDHGTFVCDKGAMHSDELHRRKTVFDDRV